jgi:hypothetical protein
VILGGIVQERRDGRILVAALFDDDQDDREEVDDVGDPCPFAHLGGVQV